MKRNRGKIECSIQAVLKVVSAPAHIWKRGARCFVGRPCTRRLDEAATFFVPTLAGKGQANRLRRMYCGLSLFLRSCLSTKVMPAKAARGYRMSGMNGCQGASWSEA